MSKDMTNINDFFLTTNSIENKSLEDYEKAELLVNAAKAFSRSTHQCVYIIDYFKKNFLYVSENISYWCGLSADKVKEIGYKLYIEHVPEEEQQMLLEINQKGFELYNHIPVEERVHSSISYDFHIVNNKKKRLINHHLTPMLLDSTGHIWLALCTISMSSATKAGNIVFKKEGESSFYEFSLSKHKWEQKEGISISEIEKDILILSAQGQTMNEIADKLCKSIDTIKTYKRVLFLRLGVKNIVEAISFASNYRMI